MHVRMSSIAPAVVLGLLVQAAAVLAGDHCCAHCGCECRCRKVCRLVCEEKKVDVICWGCKCEDFCVPGPGKPGCLHCEQVCGTCDQPCDSKAPYAEPKSFVWRNWIPSCAQIYTKKKLMQQVVSKKVPSYKWVVEELCPDCEATCPCASIEPGATIPQPPVVDAKLKYGGIKLTAAPDAAARKR